MQAEKQQDWFVYHKATTIGPLSRTELIHRILAHEFSGEALVMCEGITVWRTLLDAIHYISNEPSSRKAREPFERERRIAQPRVPVKARAQVMAESRSLTAECHDISLGGIFVLTKELQFKIGDVVSLRIAVDALEDNIVTVGTIVRHNCNPRFPVGYGIQFRWLAPKIRVAILRLTLEKAPSGLGAVWESP